MAEKNAAVMGLVFAVSLMLIAGFAQEKKWPEKNFFETSLHFTSRGIAYWYAKEQGGVERLSGVPITELNCLSCHVKTCDACHAKEVDGRAVYSTAQAKSEEACLACHDFGDIGKAQAAGQPIDLHLEKGMKCLDCHTAREIHGDGKIYNSYRDEGALDVTCEKCHPKVSDSESHKVHGDKLACDACHTKEITSCHNCHFETRVKEGKSASLPIKDAFFLVNSRGRVRPAVCLTFVWQNKAMVEFSPSFPHTTFRKGRTCEDCHATTAIRDIEKNTFRLAWHEEGGFRSAAGVFPVLEGWKWNLPYYNRVNDQWVRIEPPVEEIVQYSGYCTPITPEQLRKLKQPQSSKRSSQ
jgi:hypothetical protein